MNISTIYRLQREFGYAELQEAINTGLAWKMEGAYGRDAMNALEQGICLLPTTPHRDAYGNRIPARNEIKEGSKGSFQNAVNFWSDDENLFALEMMQEMAEDDDVAVF